MGLTLESRKNEQGQARKPETGLQTVPEMFAPGAQSRQISRQINPISAGTRDGNGSKGLPDDHLGSQEFPRNK